MRAGAFIQVLSSGLAQHLSDAGDQFFLVLSREQRDAVVQLDQQAAEAPYINCRRVPHPQYNLGGPVEPALDISKNLPIHKARGAEVDHFDRVRFASLDQQVLRLDVTVDQVLAFQEAQALEHLVRDLLDLRHFESSKIVTSEVFI